MKAMSDSAMDMLYRRAERAGVNSATNVSQKRLVRLIFCIMIVVVHQSSVHVYPWYMTRTLLSLM